MTNVQYFLVWKIWGCHRFTFVNSKSELCECEEERKEPQSNLRRCEFTCLSLWSANDFDLGWQLPRIPHAWVTCIFLRAIPGSITMYLWFILQSPPPPMSYWELELASSICWHSFQQCIHVGNLTSCTTPVSSYLKGPRHNQMYCKRLL